MSFSVRLSGFIPEPPFSHRAAWALPMQLSESCEASAESLSILIGRNCFGFVKAIFRKLRGFSREAFLPAGLLYAGDLALVSQLPEADAANAELTKVGMRPAADLAAVVFTGGIFLRSSLLDFHRCFGHDESLLYLVNGAPIRERNSRASSSVLAVVTKQISMPRTLSTLS